MDGVGLGTRHDLNPFAAAGSRFLPFYQESPHLPDGTPVSALDAELNIEGIPQSASGQTTLYTGVNVPELLGHQGSYPGPTMRRILSQTNLLKDARACGRSVTFLNAYPHYAPLFQPPHLTLNPDGSFSFSPEFPAMFRRRLSVTTCMMLSSGLAPRSEMDILEGTALYQEYTNRSLIQHGMDLPVFSPEQAAGIIARNAGEVDLLLYEYFQTDLYAHRHGFDEQVELIRNLDRLVESLLDQLNPATDTLVITSDHGNLEDGSSQRHTRNSVPMVAWGAAGDELRAATSGLPDVTPAIFKTLECTPLNVQLPGCKEMAGNKEAS